MTVASEIQRLQGAKASARASIINKGVNVPASAKLDTYHTYIDQIQQGSTLLGKLKLYNKFVDAKDGTPLIHNFISFNEGNKYYGCCVCDIEGSTANSLASYVYTFRKLDANNDISYVLNNVTGDVSGSIYTHASNISYWVGHPISETQTNIKIIFFVNSTYSSNPYFCYQVLWDYENSGTTTNTLIGRGETTDISDYPIDLEGYYEFPSSVVPGWVDSVTGNEIDDDAYIYLTLK